MSGQEDFGPLLEALVACVGVIDVISLFGYLFDRRTIAKESMTTDTNNNDVRVRDKSPKFESSRSVPRVLVDGVAPSKLDDDVIDSLRSKVNELEAKVSELEIKSRESSMERFVEMERYRRSRTPSPFPVVHLTKDDEDSSYDDDETNTSSTESRAGSVRHPLKPIARDDEFRKTIKRSSQISHGSREDELNDFTMLEKQETENMEDYVPITYEGQDDTARHRHAISPIQEVPTCPIHGEIERSPEPGMSSMVEKPWCDIKKDAGEIRKQERRDQLRRSLSIDEVPEVRASDEPMKSSFEEITEVQVSEEPMRVAEVNENFIKMEQNALQQQRNVLQQQKIANQDNEVHQQHSKLLVKQAHVSSEDQLEEVTTDLETIPFEIVEIIAEPEAVLTSEMSVLVTDVKRFDEPSTDTQKPSETVSHAGSSTATINVSSQNSFYSLEVVNLVALSFYLFLGFCGAFNDTKTRCEYASDHHNRRR